MIRHILVTCSCGGNPQERVNEHVNQHIIPAFYSPENHDTLACHPIRYQTWTATLSMAKVSSHHSLVEQNEVHHRVALVVLLQLAIQSVFQGRRIRDAGVGATGALPAEGGEYHRLLEHLGLVRERAEKKGRAI